MMFSLDNPTFDRPSGPLSKRPVLDRLLPVSTSLSQDKEEGPDKLSQTISPYTAGPTAESPSTRLKLPLSALSRVDAFKSNTTTTVIDKASKGSHSPSTAEPIGVPAPRALRQTTSIQIPITDPTQRDPTSTSTPGISASTTISSAAITPLITPQSGNRLGGLDGVKIVGRGETGSPMNLSGEDDRVKGYTSWKEGVSVGNAGGQGPGIKGGKVTGTGLSGTVGQVVKPGLHPLQHLWYMMFLCCAPSELLGC